MKNFAELDQKICSCTDALTAKMDGSTVRRGLRDLRDEGLVETEQRYRKKGGKSTLLYKLCRE